MYTMHSVMKDFSEKLIAEVQLRPCLYNPNEPGYKDRSRVEKAWQDVATSLSCTADAAKKRWQNLRGSYGKSRANQHASSRLVTAKRHPFYLGDRMSFLDPFMTSALLTGSYGISELEVVMDEESQADANTRTSSPSMAPSSPSPPPQPDSVSLLEFSEKLIAEVKMRPCLYNPRETGYKDRSRVEAEWQDVATSLSCTADAAKRRWQNLRGSYSRSRGNKYSQIGSAAAKRHPFYLGDRMSFLDPFMAPASMVGSYDISGLVVVMDEESQADANTRTSSPSMAPSSPSPPPQPEVQETIPSSPSLDRRTPKRKSAPGGEEEMSWQETAKAFLTARMERAKERNPDLDFLKGLLPHIKQLKKTKKRQYFKNINNLLFQMLDEQDEEESNAPCQCALCLTSTV